MKTKGLLIIALVAMSFSVSAQAWRQQYTNMTGTSTYVDQISIIDSNTAWVNGSNGSSTVAGFINAHSRTNDGGETWVAGTYNGIASTVDIRVLAAPSYNNAFAIAMDTVSSVASFWKTTDGGANWSLVTGIMNASGTFADGVIFWNTNKGFCYGDPVSNKFDIYYTTDGGTTWTPTLAANTPSPLDGEYGFNGPECVAKAGNGVAAFITNKGRVYRTTDYGITWDTTDVAPFASCPYSNIISMSSANFIIVGNLPTNTSSTYDYKYTTDGGATWSTYAAASGTFYTYQLAYVPGTSNMFVATSPYSTSKGVGYANDGLNWADFYDPIFLQAQGENMQMLGVAFADSANGWVGNYSLLTSDNTILRYQKNNSSIFSFIVFPSDTLGAPMGTITGTSTGNYTSGTSISVTAAANPGYVFVGWYSGYPNWIAASVDPTYTFNLTSNEIAQAYFTRDLTYGVTENGFGKLTVSPNPAANNVTIALNSKQNGVFNVNIVDLTGKSVYTNSLEANATMNVDVTAFAKGVYFVKINNDKTQFVQKLIVK